MLEFFSILAVGLAGGALPLAFRWSHRQFHAALALASGVFLGAVFLHLLPMVGAVSGTGYAHLIYGPMMPGVVLGGPLSHDHNGDGIPDHLPGQPGVDLPAPAGAPADGAPAADGSSAAATTDAAGHTHGAPIAWLWVLLGVVGVYFVEALVVPGGHHHPIHDQERSHDHEPSHDRERGHGHEYGHGHDHDHHHGDSHRSSATAEGPEAQRHRAVGWAALVGLSVHSLTSGVALAAVAENRAIATVMLWAILAHKGFESFSLASVFSMSAKNPRQVLAMVIAFSFVTPLGLLLGHQVTAVFGTGGIAVLTALAAGTFLYVCIGELLPEVFHHREDVFAKIALLSLGVGIMYLMHQVGGL